MTTPQTAHNPLRTQDTKHPLHTFVTGAAVGLNEYTLPGLVFNINASYTGCLICGTIYQSLLDRHSYRVSQRFNPSQIYLNKLIHDALLMRKEWDEQHAKTHTHQEHVRLKLSKQMCTPEAAVRLAPFGIFPLAPDSDVAAAMFEAKRAPIDDVEGS